MKRAKITHMWGDWEYYYVSSRFECRDKTDREAYELLEEGNDPVILVGKVCAEQIRGDD